MARAGKKGFTIIEVAMSLGIVVLLTSFAYRAFNSYRESNNLLRAVDIAVENLSKARVQTLSSKGSVAYGVHFSSTTITLFQGSTYDAATTTNAVTDLPPLIEILSFALASTSRDIVFQRLTGDVSNTGTITFHIIRDPAKTHQITIGSSGLVEVK